MASWESDEKNFGDEVRVLSCQEMEALLEAR